MCAKDLHTIKSGAFVGFATGYSIGFEHGNAGLQVIAPRYLNVGAKLGYNLYFSKALGLRGYVDYIYGMNLHSSESGTNGSYLHYVNANVDFLNTFYNSEQVSAGWFAGLSLGAGIHSGGAVKIITQSSNLSNVSGFDLGINLGLRTLFGKHHGIEFFTRFGVIGASARAEYPNNSKTDMSTNQIYNAGIRYTYNF